MSIHFQAANGQSEIYIKRDVRFHIADYIDLDRKVFIISDNGVPYQYVETIANQCRYFYIKIVPRGEQSKSLKIVKEICINLADLGFTKKDLIFAIGGGVVGDLSGFVASIYLQGIPIVSFPTTTLSQIDSSIGGKTAVNISKIKNIVGSFYQPSKVFIDLNTLATLTKREYYSGLVEALKAGMIRDSNLFDIFNNNVADFNEDIPSKDLESIIEKSLYVKKSVVDEDEKETGLRKILNFGHTFGHAIEAINMPNLYHGECVGLGMLMIIENKEIRETLQNILNKMGMPTHIDYDLNQVLSLITKDKKYNGKIITIAQVDEIGKGYLKNVDLDWLRNCIEERRI